MVKPCAHAKELFAANHMPYSQTEDDLKNMIKLLRSDGWDSWASFFGQALSMLNSGNAGACAEKIMSGSGGMGSLNDIVLGQIKGPRGEFKWADNAKELNDRYQELLESLHAFSAAVKRSQK